MSRFNDIYAALAVKRTMQVRREEYLDHMTFRANLRPLFREFLGPMVGLPDEWRAQGATEDEINLSGFRYRSGMSGYVPVATGWIGGPEEKVIEETDEHIIGTDYMGRRVMLCKQSASIPLPLEYPVKNMDDWRALKSHYTFSPARFEKGWEEQSRQALRDGRVLAVPIPGGYDAPRQLLGDENLCLAYHDQPELIHDILDTIGDTAYKVLDHVSARVRIDQLSVHEDMAGKSGPIAGPAQVNEFIKPYYRRIWDMLAARGARIFVQDSDGNLEAIIPNLLDAGLNVMEPMEPGSGMDIVKLREKYGTRLAFRGGIDKYVLMRTPAEIERELEYKLPPMIRTGGCDLSLDHRIPNGTPLANYRFYIRKVWQIIERETQGWAPVPDRE